LAGVTSSKRQRTFLRNADILELMGKVYHNDAITRQQTMTPDQRLTFHQTESVPLKSVG
jgi:hypothetical protein